MNSELGVIAKGKDANNNSGSGSSSDLSSSADDSDDDHHHHQHRKDEKEKDVEYNMNEENVEQTEGVHSQRVSLQSGTSTMTTGCSVSSRGTAEKNKEKEEEDAEHEDLQNIRKEMQKECILCFVCLFLWSLGNMHPMGPSIAPRTDGVSKSNVLKDAGNGWENASVLVPHWLCIACCNCII